MKDVSDDKGNRVYQLYLDIPKELNKRRGAEPDPEEEDDEEFNKIYPIKSKEDKRP